MSTTRWLVPLITNSPNRTCFSPASVKNRTLYHTVHGYNIKASFPVSTESRLLGSELVDCTITGIDRDSITLSDLCVPYRKEQTEIYIIRPNLSCIAFRNIPLSYRFLLFSFLANMYHQQQAVFAELVPKTWK